MSEPMRWRARARGDESGITEVQFASKQNADSWMATMDPARAGTEDEYVLEEIRQPLSEESLALARAAAASVLVTAHPNAEGHVAVFEDDEQTAEPCPYVFPAPSWAGADQTDPCPCDLPKGHDGVHECEHIRAKRAREATKGVQ